MLFGQSSRLFKRVEFEMNSKIIVDMVMYTTRNVFLIPLLQEDISITRIYHEINQRDDFLANKDYSVSFEGEFSKCFYVLHFNTSKNVIIFYCGSMKSVIERYNSCKEDQQVTNQESELKVCFIY
jgi:hypothetical protein